MSVWREPGYQHKMQPCILQERTLGLADDGAVQNYGLRSWTPPGMS